MADDYYQLLGVPRSADAKEIQRAYRKLARTYHPDVNKQPGAEDRFKQISEAYHVLSDPESRAQYDRFGPDFRHYAGAEREYASQGAGGARGGGRTRARPGASGFSWSSAQAGAGPGGASVDWDDLFGDVFGSMRGMDSEAELELSVDEAFRGGPRTIILSGPDGDRQTFEIQIPPGTLDGQRIRVSGGGRAGRQDGGAGDLVITVRVRSDKRLRLDGKNIEMDLPISPWEAALGANVSTRAPGGPITVRVPAGSSSGRRLRLKGQGMPQPNGKPGDLFARVKIMVPPRINDRERELFEQLKRESSFDPRSSS
ncbi:curved DNA-binding protein [Leifsonia sp. 98AMF]|uniref:DnaJ C-terminal domain-containing protein n=1 Tax=unclassified Leifsonia TaxID=2663824 RepID=UPI00087C719B|nr:MULTISPECIES: DnaJ C-terminal domain-containing protein [unclassified Leifsonia]SDH60364.1 curved DNA-binding protein [Leifsonia sp. 197AMF]SDI78734.1 curved DNA-binding protein [Leifsonia sp. 466MF]SDK07312.1 curved DNA-binding protein [Leifsonia sp. 157MF]SDN82255.1 curved DNA-binding protein [Leifsonia sp. 509MF]SEN25066.1 curved DNA-binding protein [Leifsonia sp. 467MF]